MKRSLFALLGGKSKSGQRRELQRTLRLEQCEERRLMAADPLTAYLPASAPLVASAPAAFVGPIDPIAALRGTGIAVAPTGATAKAAAAAAPVVTTQATTATKIDLDVTIKSDGVVPTQAKDLNLLHFFGGEKLTVPTVVKNYGPGVANGSATVSLYLSTTRDLGASPTLLGQKTVAVNLGNNATTAVSLDTTVPTSLTAGTKYWIVAKITTPLTQSTINDIRPSDRQFEFVGTPTNNKAAFQPDASGSVPYFKFVRDTLNSRLVAVENDIAVRINDPKLFIGSFEGDELSPYMKNGVPYLGMGINLNKLDSYMEHQVAIAVRSFYQSAYGQKLTASDALIINMLKTQATIGSKMQVISGNQDQTLFDLSYPDYTDVASNAVGATIWSRISPLAKIALADQVYANGKIYANMIVPLKALDYVRAGFQLVDNKQTTQSAGWTIRAEAEYQNLLYSTRTSLGKVI